MIFLMLIIIDLSHIKVSVKPLLAIPFTETAV